MKVTRFVKTALFISVMLCTTWMGALPSYAGSNSVVRSKDDHLFLGMALRQVCVENFPRFSNASKALDSSPAYVRRPGRKIWDHKKLAVVMSLESVDGKPACVMRLVAKRFRDGDWAAYAVPVFGATWESNQTVVSKGESHPGDKFDQHMVVRFPTHERFTFDADLRKDGLWAYTIALIAK